MSERYQHHEDAGWIDFLNPRGHYWHSREVRLLAQGLPACLVGVLILILVAIPPAFRAQKVDRYRFAFEQAVYQHEYALAHVWLKKLDRLSRNSFTDDSFKFKRAIVDFHLGDVERSMETINKLAPRDEVGLGAAHLWLARQVIQKDPQLSRADMKLLGHHLEASLKSDPDNAEIHLLLGNYFFASGNRSRSIHHLQVAVGTFPNVHFVLATLYDDIGDYELAEEHYEKASQRLSAVLSKQPGSMEARINLAIAQYKLGSFNNAVETLQEGIGVTGQVGILGEALSWLCITESDRLRQKSEPNDTNYQESLVLLDHALKYDPTNRDAIDRFAAISGEQGEMGENARDMVRSLLASGRMTSSAHLLLGTMALQRGENNRARAYMRLAYRRDPGSAIVVNNYAWMLANGDPSQLEYALDLVSTALGQLAPEDPNHASILETRGHLLAKLERWEDAVVDYELALAHQPASKQLHHSLENAYRALGHLELATKHKELADRLIAP